MLAAGQKSATISFLVENSVDPDDRSPATPNASQEALLTVQVNANGPDMPFMATAAPMPSYLTDITDGEVKGTKTIVFASTAPGAAPIAGHSAQHTIDGKKFDGEVGVSVRLNTVEEWKVINQTYAPNQIAHPFHIHINPFQITELFDPNAVLSSTAGAGTVTTTAGSPTVTGTGTLFDQVFHAGDFVWINGEKPATVLAVAGPTSMTINNNARGVTGATYTVAIPQYALKGQEHAGQCALDPADDTTWKPCSNVATPNRIWWDVFSIPSGRIFTTSAGTTVQVPGHFKMRSRFVDYAGFYVLHCHILAHEDRGMMTVVEVSPLQPPYSHH
jgi:hypothetical protein